MINGHRACLKQLRCSGEIPEGVFTVLLHREGYYDSTFQIQVPNGTDYYKSILVEKPGLLALKSVDSATGKTLPGVVYMDDKEMGHTPWTGSIPLGTKVVSVRYPGYHQSIVHDRPLPRKELPVTVHLSEPDLSKMAKAPKGCFQMGYSEGHKNAKPEHKVCLDSFFIDKTEVSQVQYKDVTDNEPSFYGACGANCPVESVSWKDAKAYCEKVGKRLPTEAEWEYAARAGSSSKWGCGIMSTCLSSTSWSKDNSDGHPHPVEKKSSNSWGIYDMLGNVAEWTGDWYGDTYYSFSPKKNPRGANGGDSRVVRGGSWAEDDENLLPSARGGYDPNFRETIVGFRCAADSK